MIGFIVLSVGIFSSLFRSDDYTANTRWDHIKTSFDPHAQYQREFGNYRSPLEFNDGSIVQTQAQWKRRRVEILDNWQQHLGKWPDLITNPIIEFLEVEERDGIAHHCIRFRWTPNEMTIGYLLFPNKTTQSAAVITVFYEPETALGLDAPHRDFAVQLEDTSLNPLLKVLESYASSVGEMAFHRHLAFRQAGESL